jgi:hypothetical protein
MRLLSTSFVKNLDEPLKVEEFLGAQIPPHAILSHTWGAEEITLQDVVSSTHRPEHKAGFSKIRGCCTRAAQDGYEYVPRSDLFRIHIFSSFSILSRLPLIYDMILLPLYNL